MRRHTSDTGERVLNTDDPLSPRRGAESSKKTAGARDVKDGGRKEVEGADGKKMEGGRGGDRQREKGGERASPGRSRGSEPLVQQYRGSLASQKLAPQTEYAAIKSMLYYIYLLARRDIWCIPLSRESCLQNSAYNNISSFKTICGIESNSERTVPCDWQDGGRRTGGLVFLALFVAWMGV